MEYVKIGKIVNTHGIKGELRIRSDFEYKDRVFKKGFILYILLLGEFTFFVFFKSSSELQ